MKNKTNKTNKTLAYYRALPYTTVLKRDEEGDFVARIQEVPGCLGHGGTEAEALKRLNSMFALWIEDALEAGDPIPEPELESSPSGKWLQRVPRRLHRELTQLAARENVSLNQLVTAMLTEGLTARTCAQIVDAHLTKTMFSTPTTGLMKGSIGRGPQRASSRSLLKSLG